MYQSNNNPLSETTGEMIRSCFGILVRTVCTLMVVAFCLLPFALIEHHGKESFWYCTGAFGVYLIGLSQMLGRRF